MSLNISLLMDILISYLNLKSITLRNFFAGKEVILIENGKISFEPKEKDKPISKK